MTALSRKVTAVSLAAIAAAAILSRSSAAADNTPALVVSIASYDKLREATKDVFGFAKSSLEPVETLDAKLKELTGGIGLSGIDTTRPWGAIVPRYGHLDAPVIFVPCDDLTKYLAALPPQITHSKLPGSILKIGSNPPLFLKSTSHWVFAARGVEQLHTLPTDPVELLRDLPQRYVLALKIYPGSISILERDSLLGWLRESAKGRLDARTNMMLKLVENSLDDIKSVTLGGNVDTSKRMTTIDVDVEPIVDGPLGAAPEWFRNHVSQFGAIRAADAILAARVTYDRILSPDQVEKLPRQEFDTLAFWTAMIQRLKPGEREDELRASAQKLVHMWYETVRLGKHDYKNALFVSPSPILVSACRLADTEPLEAFARDEYKRFGKLRDELHLEMSEGTHRDHSLRTFSVPVESQEIKTLVGPRAEGAIAIGRHSVWFAFGGMGAAARLKQVMDESAEAAPPAPAFEGVFRLANILTERNDTLSGMNAARKAHWRSQLAKLGPSAFDFSVRCIPQPNSVLGRIQIGEGVLQFFANKTAEKISEQPSPAEVAPR
ncbi:MAG: hypothetical protein K8T25_20400 [Planctomycetia bacterium]|nr:hypothetical protein [Planctomycetia bacterium]